MDHVTLHEVGPRDGLQNEPGVMPVTERVRFVQMLARAGVPFIEVGAFVSPRWVPQMAQTDAVMAGLAPGPVYEVLVPNMRGWAAFEAVPHHGVYHVAVFVAASEGFSKANLNCSVDESFARASKVVAAADAAGVPVRGYVSCVTDCPFDGPVAPDAVARVVARMHGLGVREVSLGETIGKGTPERVAAMLSTVTDVVPVAQLAGHFHDTGGRALDNIMVSLEAGVRVFDAAVGGLGGCPYAPGAPGNVATEQVVQMLHQAGFSTGIDEVKLAEAVAVAKEIRA